MNPINANINLSHSDVDITMSDKELEELKEQYIQIINNMDLLVEQLKNYEDDRNKILKILYSKYNIEDGLLDMDFEEDDMNETIPDILQATNDFSSGNLEDLDNTDKDIDSESTKKPKAKKTVKTTKAKKNEGTSTVESTLTSPSETIPAKKTIVTKKKTVKKEQVETNAIEDESKPAVKKTVAKAKKSPKSAESVEILDDTAVLQTDEAIIQEEAKIVKPKVTKKKVSKKSTTEDIIIEDELKAKPVKKTKKTSKAT